MGGDAALDEAIWPDGTQAIVQWWSGARSGRDELPWRDEHDPWRVLVGETMLAQTQAGRVATRYRLVIENLATPEATAQKSVAEMIELWSGLGYYRRAVSLRAAAIVLVERHGGVVPNDLGELLELPGVGAYTARAVLAFAFNESVGVLDTNIGRVLARAVSAAPLSRSEAQRLADSFVPADGAREWNLALMDFGALVCQAGRPKCAVCPLEKSGGCRWRAGNSTDDPAARSAATARPQRRFLGSDRQGRGRILRAALSGPILRAALPTTAGWPEDEPRAERVARQLIAEGLLEETVDGRVGLPN